MLTYCGCAVFGAVLGVAMLAVAAFAVSEFTDRSLY